MLQLTIAFAGLIALLAGAIAAYYAICFLVLRVFGVFFPLAGRRPRKKTPGTPGPT